MARRKKIAWANGDVFGVELENGKFNIGQILDLQMPNVVRCALYNEVLDNLTSVNLNSICEEKNLISLIACSREQLDYGVWHILGNKPVQIPFSKFPNEQYRSKGWVKSTMYDAGLVEEFLNAYHALVPWDDWYNPNFLDEFLIDKSKKPSKLILIKG